MEEIKPTPFNKKEKMAIAAFLIVALGMLALVSFYVYQKYFEERRAGEKVSIAELPEKKEVPKEEERGEDEQADEAVSPAEIDILVLNGGAAVGSAGKIKDILVESGYSLAQADDASSRDYKGLTIYYKEEFKEAAADIKEKLSSNYLIIELKQEINENEPEADIVLVAGK